MTKYNPNKCSKCGVSFDGGSILETFLKQRDEGVKCWQDKSNDEIDDYIKTYYLSPYRWGRQIGIELAWDDPDHYDGVSQWMCPDCETKWNRFTGEEII